MPAEEWEILVWERAVAEVWRGESQLAKLRLDNEEVIIELYPNAAVVVGITISGPPRSAE